MEPASPKRSLDDQMRTARKKKKHWLNISDFSLFGAARQIGSDTCEMLRPQGPRPHCGPGPTLDPPKWGGHLVKICLNMCANTSLKFITLSSLIPLVRDLVLTLCFTCAMARAFQVGTWNLHFLRDLVRLK